MDLIRRSSEGAGRSENFGGLDWMMRWQPASLHLPGGTRKDQAMGKRLGPEGSDQPGVYFSSHSAMAALMAAWTAGSGTSPTVA